MEEDHIYSPSELCFDVGRDGNEVFAFIVPLDEDSPDSDSLGGHNVTGLPSYFGGESMECTWAFTHLSEDQLKQDLADAGLEYRIML